MLWVWLIKFSVALFFSLLNHPPPLKLVLYLIQWQRTKRKKPFLRALAIEIHFLNSNMCPNWLKSKFEAIGIVYKNTYFYGCYSCVGLIFGLIFGLDRTRPVPEPDGYFRALSLNRTRT